MQKIKFMRDDSIMHLSAFQNCLACRLRATTPLFPYDEKPRGPVEYFPRVVSRLQRKVAWTLVRNPAPGSCANLVEFCSESDGAREADPLKREINANSIFGGSLKSLCA